MEYHNGERIQNAGTVPSMAAARYEDKTAFTMMGQGTSYEEVEERANNIAQALVDEGVEPGDRVGLLVPNAPLFAPAYFGAIKAGAVATPLNLRMDPETLEYVLEDAGTDIVVRSAYLSEGTLGWDPDILAENVETTFSPNASLKSGLLVKASRSSTSAPSRAAGLARL